MRSKWIKKVHQCSQPNGVDKAVGSVWRCRCGKRWEIVLKRTEPDGLHVRIRWRVL